MGIRPDIPRKNLTELSLDDLTALFGEWGEAAYRAKQVYRWVFQRGVRDISEMTDLSKSLRARLVEEGYSIGRVKTGRVAESIDGTRKLSIKLEDGSAVETVLIPMEEGKFTQCLSTQVGCAMDCKFCYTGSLGLSRHLTGGEIIDQVIVARNAVPEGARVSHLVYMGMGEPLHNLDGVLDSLKAITHPDGLGYSERRVTVSTSGLVPQIRSLGQHSKVNLALSLNASNDEVRDQIMPINKRYNIATLMETLREYPLPPRRKMTIEYVLLGGLNDTDDDAYRLVKLLKGLPVRVNIIPWNPFNGPKYARPEDERVRSFQNILKRRGLTVTVRTTKGLDIDAACGQLGERAQ
jgi:23S rRNA (adenine2503-C2)-methyltransferase